MRVAPNLYPALEHQEVVVHSPRHVRTFAELDDDEIAAVAEAWQARGEAARDAGFDYQHALVNEGRAAGSSLPHSHSQLAWLHEDHLEVVPRLSVLAGLELGAGIYVNTVAPEDAAETLRAV